MSNVTPLSLLLNRFHEMSGNPNRSKGEMLELGRTLVLVMRKTLRHLETYIDNVRER